MRLGAPVTVGELKKRLKKLPDHLRITIYDPDNAVFRGVETSKRVWVNVDEHGCGVTGRTEESADNKFDREIGMNLFAEGYEALLLNIESFE